MAMCMRYNIEYNKKIVNYDRINNYQLNIQFTVKKYFADCFESLHCYF